MAAVWDSVADYVHSLGLDAYLVGGAVRDELLGRTPPELDFVVPGVGHAELREALEPYGKVEDLVVADQRVGVRLLPRDKAARALQPAGIEFTPPRVERSTGPGRHDFEIVADSEISLEQDMERRDFTINAIARRLETGEILDPLGGRADLERGVLRTPGRRASATTRSGSSAASASSRSSTSIPTRTRCARCTSGRRGSSTSRGSGSAAGWPRTGWASSRSSCSARSRRRRCGWRGTPACSSHVLPEFAPAIGYEQQSGFQHLTLDEHVFAVVQAAADAARRCEVRLAALLHDLGKPRGDRDGGATSDRRRDRRPGAPPAALPDEAARVRRQARAGASVPTPDEPRPSTRAAFLARHGERLGVRPARAPRRRPGGEDAGRGRTRSGRALPCSRRAGAVTAAPARRPRRRRRAT